MIEALVVNPDMSMSLQHIDGGGDDIHKLVGGYFQIAPCSDNELTIWTNEDGKLIGLPFNEVATAMWHATTPMMIGHDHLVGTVVITGGCDRHGNTMTLPKGWPAKFSEAIDIDLPEGVEL